MEVYVIVSQHSWNTLVPGVFTKQMDAVSKVLEIGKTLGSMESRPYKIEQGYDEDEEAIVISFNGHEAYKIVKAPLT